MVIARLESPCAPAESSIAPSRMGRYNRLNQYRHILSRLTAARFVISVGFIVYSRQFAGAKPIRQATKSSPRQLLKLAKSLFPCLGEDHDFRNWPMAGEP